ncbi:NCS2 family permease [Clostridium algidicarnis]|uniref:AGZA family xanthine/uracil permease-like MFS transporter n=2 Tax=Clostridium algidicarnis TaxID=37659 RepID=A0A2S6G1I5_9CLOT|nr:NCS2 family permease [Clostridium algidicarnis]MBB6631154.1 NCS2 family permease [Clostridium algidicarnis]MBB6696194.1 NCS2 family permease [Clostridium algidicarnis]MBU3193402.1 NCS2 family permease [Clostridium algidicarnis]MBU3203186.1 NCS2 family permease [Clostridium algidicarnis]MBU3211340.1 NCS2 family permease [Clostridium algidicarnis]
MDKLFSFNKLKERKDTNIRKEIIAGITTFLTMAYIIAVNPTILGATGMPAGALVTATCLSAGVATIMMGIYADLPFALASGMGLNAFFAYTVVIKMNVPWEVALTAVFVEGIIFIVLSLTNVREAVINSIPMNLKLAVTAGIGLFITFIGFVDSGMVIKNDATLVGLGNFMSPTVLITAVGVVIIVVLSKKNVKGAILFGIFGSTILSWIYAIISPESAALYNIFLPSGIFKFESLAPIAFKLDFSYMTDPSKIWGFVVIVFTFLFVDFFDTIGTLVGVASKANMLDENGRVPRAGRALLSDAVGTTFGALIGVSTVTTFVESSAGVAEGGRTGLTSIVTGILFLIAMFFSPIFVAIPSAATAPALIIVGFFMMENVVKINFSDFTEGVPAFLIIALMPLTYSIGDGLTIGILSYVIINLVNNLFSKEKKKISPVMIILGIIFMAKIIFTGLS